MNVEQGGVTVHILREKFEAINIGGTADTDRYNSSKKIGQKPIQTDTKPIQTGKIALQKKAIIEMIQGNPEISMDEISRNISITKSSVQRRLEALVKEHRIRHIGPTNGGFWEIIEKK